MISFISAAIMLFTTSLTMPASPPPIVLPPEPPTVAQPSPPPTESWADKMWRRYKDGSR